MRAAQLGHQQQRNRTETTLRQQVEMTALVRKTAIKICGADAGQNNSQTRCREKDGLGSCAEPVNWHDCNGKVS